MADNDFLTDEEAFAPAPASSDSDTMSDEEAFAAPAPAPVKRKPLGEKNDPYVLEGDPRYSTPGGRQLYTAEYPPYDENAFIKARKVVNGVEYTEHDGTGVISDPDGRVITDPDVLRRSLSLSGSRPLALVVRG